MRRVARDWSAAPAGRRPARSAGRGPRILLALCRIPESRSQEPPGEPGRLANISPPGPRPTRSGQDLLCRTLERHSSRHMPQFGRTWTARGGGCRQYRRSRTSTQAPCSTFMHQAGKELFDRLPSSAPGANTDLAHNKDAYGNQVVHGKAGKVWLASRKTYQFDPRLRVLTRRGPDALMRVLLVEAVLRGGQPLC